MAEQDGWVQPDGMLLNGLRPGESIGSIFQVRASTRWLIAEERAAELIACIKPIEASEEHRLAVADYIRRLIMQCFPCQVFTFGSGPLKTYLPDGDIDLTIFSWTPNLKDSWANDVHNMLEREVKNENAEFRIMEVQFIQAKVKIVKCHVENIVVDISFNQIGGLGTLCFLEEVDLMINHNHLFKRSIILIKAWCYYESRILGAPHGLISTYALETLVLYIFQVFKDTFKGPLEVLYRFLEFFSKFDWDNFCVSLWGPVPLESLPKIAAELPRKDSRQLLLSNEYLEACSYAYGDNPLQEQQNTDFLKKSFNVVDSLRVSNNLGQSITKGNFFRIRSAFAFGAMKLARLLDCPEDHLYVVVNQFFVNTWQRLGNRNRPDVPCKVPRCIKPSSLDSSECMVEERQESCTIEANNASEVQHTNAGKSRAYQLSSSLSTEIARAHTNTEITDVHGDPASRLRIADNKNSHIASTKSERSSLSGAVEGTLKEEQDHMNMLGSSMFHGFNGHYGVPLTMSSGHLPFALPASVLASLSCSQKIVGGMFPGNFSLAENPWASNMPFMAAPPFFPCTGLSSTNSEVNETVNQGMNPAEVNSWEVEIKVWRDHDSNSNGGFDLDNGTSEIAFDDRQPTIASHQTQGNHESFRNNSFDRHYQNRISNGAEQTINSGTVPSARNSISRSRTSGCSWDESAGNVSKVTSKRQGRKISQSAMKSGKAKNFSEHSSTQPDDDENGIYRNKPANINVIDRNELRLMYPRSGQMHQLPGVELPQTSGIETAINQVSVQRATDNPGAPQLRFILAGPPIPFLTMLNVYNVPNESGTEPNARTAENQEPDKSELNQKLDHICISSNTETLRWEIFDGDFLTHLRNLLYARWLVYPSKFTHPTVYRFPSGGPGRSLLGNMNLDMPFTVGDGRFIPVAATDTSMPGLPANAYQPFVEEPRCRGTGTFFPNPKVDVWDRQVSRNRREKYRYGRNDHKSDREGNWNGNKPRGPGRNHNKNQYEKRFLKMDTLPSGESRTERSRRGSYRRPDTHFTHQVQVDLLHSPMQSQRGSADVAHDAYSLPTGSTNEVSPGLTSVPSLPMTSHRQVLEFGSFGQVELSSGNRFSAVSGGSQATRVPEEQRFNSNPSHHSSPDQPSSPDLQR